MFMKKQWVIIRIETKSREFLSKMLITYELVKEGFGVIVTNKLGIDASVFPQGAYLINCLFANGYNNIKKLNEKEHKILLLDEEGLVHLSPEACVNRIHKRSLDLIDYVYCFGNEQKDILTGAFPDAINKIIVTGNPRMNLLNNFFRSIILKDTDKITSKYGKYILIVSNFTYANPDCSETTVEGKKHYLCRIITSMKVEDEITFGEHFDYIYKQLHAMQDLVLKIHDQFVDYNIVIRPHPSEDMRTWYDFAEGHERIKIVREMDMNSWLIGASVVVENCCTSAIESMFLGVPCISYRPLQDNRFDQPLPSLLSKNVFTEEEALSQINNILESSKSYNYSEYLNKSEYYVSYQNGDESVKKIVESIKNIGIPYKDYGCFIRCLKKFSIDHIVYVNKRFLKILLKKIPSSMIEKAPKSIAERLIAAKEDNEKSKFGDINQTEIENVLIQISNLYKESFQGTVMKNGEDYIVYTH